MSHNFTANWFACLLDATARSLLLFALVGLLLFYLRRSSASVRHLILTLTLGGLLCLPLLSRILPHWNIPILAGSIQKSSELALASPQSVDAVVQSGNPAVSHNEASKETMLPATIATVPAATTGLFVRTGWLFNLWLLGVLVMLLRFLVGIAQLRQVARRCCPVTEGRLYNMAVACSEEVRAKRPVSLLQGVSEETPMIWSFFSPTLVLPQSAATWPLPRLRAVFLHEFAHVARGDWLTQVLAHLVCALYWFHPLVWWAARRMRIESECACDDLVLRAGFRSPDYATQILEVFRAMKAKKNTLNLAVPMVRHSELKERLQAVLEKGRSRSPVTPKLLVLLVSAMACALLMLAALRPGAQAQDTGGSHLACQENLKKLGTALLMYAQDYDGKLPPMKTQQQVQSRVHLYLVDARIRPRDPAQADPFFSCPETQKPYQLNAAMSGKIALRRGNRSDFVKNASQITLVRDGVPHKAEGAPWNVLYADGHVAAVEKTNDEAGIKGNPDILPRVFRFDRKRTPRNRAKQKPLQKNVLTKRLIGKPGDIIEIKNGAIYINGKKVGKAAPALLR